MTTVQEIRKKFEQSSATDSNQVVHQARNNKNVNEEEKIETTSYYNEVDRQSFKQKLDEVLMKEKENEDNLNTLMQNSNLDFSDSDSEENNFYENIYENIEYPVITNTSVEFRATNRYDDTEQQNCKSNNTFPDVRNSKFKNILNELVATEVNFVSNLRTGYENYIKIFENENELPKGLKAKKYVLFRNLDEILEFHENDMLPMLQINQYDLTELCLSFNKFIKENKFFPYILYYTYRERAENLCETHKNFFDKKAKQFNDNLGIANLLNQPLCRVSEYVLTFANIIEMTFTEYNHDEKIKPKLTLYCKTEKNLRDFLKFTEYKRS